jgi:diguanylate cyclase (GGDEF)-like protein
VRSQLKPTAFSPYRNFDWPTFCKATAGAAIVLLLIVLVPQKFAQQARLENTRSTIASIGRMAASVVDGDLHRQLIQHYSAELYGKVLEPLVDLHSANPDIFYLYTMVEKDGVAHFVTDTAASSDLKTPHKLRPSAYMEKFESVDSANDWLKQIALGRTYVTPTFEEDDYGTFLTAHAPIYDGTGKHAGFVGVDFDVGYFLKRERRFNVIATSSIVAALILAAAIGVGAAMYQASVKRRISELYDSSIRDGLTGLFNRRGAIELYREATQRPNFRGALLLIDIDSLRLVNDQHGHTYGDVVVARTATAIREALQPGSYAARLGGDEFMVLADVPSAEDALMLANAVVENLRNTIRLGTITFTVSIGIAGVDGEMSFSQSYRRAAKALQDARLSSSSRIVMFNPLETAS